MTWWHNGKEFELDPIDNYCGMVYRIDNLTNDKFYIGKKRFKFLKTKRSKGKKRGKKTYRESDWKDYWGSNDDLKVDVAKLGPEKFKRTVLHLCKTLGECNYLEAKEQFDHKVLLNEKAYNKWIFVKVSASHVRKLAMAA